MEEKEDKKQEQPGGVPASKRAATMARMAEKYPDRNFEDDEELFGQINNDYDDYDKELSVYRDSEKKISDLMTSDPRSARFLSEWVGGKDPVVALVNMYGEDFMDILQDPERQEEIAAASKEFAERVSKEKEYEEEYQRNLQQTLSDLDAMQSEDGVSDEDIDEAMAFLVGVMKDALLGKFTPDTVRMAINALHHDGDVEHAAREGEVKGRNEKISEKLRKRAASDGVPMLGGGGGGAPRQKKRPSIFSIAEGAQ